MNFSEVRLKGINNVTLSERPSIFGTYQEVDVVSREGQIQENN